MSKYLFTSESVTKGHPDKICDQISDAILDAMLEQDPMSRVACETTCTTGQVLVMGEITTKADVDITSIVRKTIIDIGYDDAKKGLTAIPVPCLPLSTISLPILLWALISLMNLKITRRTRITLTVPVTRV